MNITTKDAVIELIQRIPDDLSVDEVVEKLYARRKIEEGLRQLDAEETLSQEEVKARLARWLA